MSTEKQRWPYAIGAALAEQIKVDLAPFCERIEIAGSIRRKKESVGDVELLFIPKFEDRQFDMFTTAPINLASETLGNWLVAGIISKRPGSDGTFAWGPKNKLAIHSATGIPIDFFATTAENWWVSLVIRTGGKDTNLKLTTGAQARGASLNAYGCGITLTGGDIIPATSERHVFELCKVPYQEPEERA